jgi:hypothetical protein
MSSREFVPAEAAIKELEQKAAEGEELAQRTTKTGEAFALRNEAKKYREWAAALKTGLWKA